MQNLDSVTAYISGAGSGIGYQTALAFASHGARIVGTDLHLQGLEKLKTELDPQESGRCRIATLDITDEAATQALVADLAETEWLPDIVVNNAGILYMASFLDTDADKWRRTLDVNVVGMAISARAFSRAWLASQRPGHLVNVGSMISVAPLPTLSAYVASKYAVEGLCEALALEFAGRDIKVTCVHPGIINTPLVRDPEMVSIPDSQFDAIKAHYAQHGVEPAVVARGILNAIRKRSSNIFVGPGSLIAPLLRKLLPRSLYRVLLGRIAKTTGYSVQASTM